MKLNIHSNLASLYRYFYLTSELPNNLCSYFWKLLIAVVCSPLVLPALLINRYVYNTFVLKNVESYDRSTGKYTEVQEYRNYNEHIPTPVGFLLNVLSLLIGGLSIEFFTWIGLFTKGFGEGWGIPLQLLFIFFMGIATIFSVFFLIYFIFTVWKKIDEIKKPKTPEEWDVYFEKQKVKEEKKRLQKIEREKNPGFFKILWIRLVAFKENNCPRIEWESKK